MIFALALLWYLISKLVLWIQIEQISSSEIFWHFLNAEPKLHYTGAPINRADGDGTRWWRLSVEQQEAMGMSAANSVKDDVTTVLPKLKLLEKSCQIIIGVFSDACQRQRRDVIRSTWSKQAARENITVIFVIGDHSASGGVSINDRDLARKEALELGDVLYISDTSMPQSDYDNSSDIIPCMLYGSRQDAWPQSLRESFGEVPRETARVENQEMIMLSAFYQFSSQHVTNQGYIVKATDGIKCWPCRIRRILSELSIRRRLYWGSPGHPLAGGYPQAKTCKNRSSGGYEARLGRDGSDLLKNGGLYAPYAGDVHVVSGDVAALLSKALAPCFAFGKVSQSDPSLLHSSPTRSQISYESHMPLLPSTFHHADLALPRLFHFTGTDIQLLPDDPMSQRFPRFQVSDSDIEICALIDNRFGVASNASKTMCTDHGDRVSGSRRWPGSLGNTPKPPVYKFQAYSGIRNQMSYYFAPVPSGISILIGVLSSPTSKSQRRRQAIRKTWLEYFSTKQATKNAFRAYFLIGNSCDWQSQQALLAEAIEYGDIMMMPGCKEAYHAIANKVVDFLHVAAFGAKVARLKRKGYLLVPSSVKHIVKVDDDAFVRVDKLIDTLYYEHAGGNSDKGSLLLSRPEMSKKLYMGIVMRNQPIVRDPAFKRYYVSPEEIPLPQRDERDVYPPYISGSGVILSRDVAVAIDPVSQAPGYMPFKFEDVNTGMLVSQIPEGNIHTTASSEILGWGHNGPVLPREWFIMHYVNTHGWSMERVLHQLKQAPYVSKRLFLEKKDFDVLNAKYDLWPVNPSAAEKSCVSRDGVAAGCKGWVIYRGLAYLKSSTAESELTQLHPNSGRILFQLNPACAFLEQEQSDGWVKIRYHDWKGISDMPEGFVVGNEAEIRKVCEMRDGCIAFGWLKGIGYLKGVFSGLRDTRMAALGPISMSVDGTSLHLRCRGGQNHITSSPMQQSYSCSEMRKLVNELSSTANSNVDDVRTVSISKDNRMYPKSACSGHNHSMRSGRDALVALTVAKSHLDMVDRIMLHLRDVQLKSVATRPRGKVDFMLLHWDLEVEHAGDLATKNAWWWHGADNMFHVTHVYHSGFVKLDFARHYLTPEAVCPYDYVFLWDADVVLSSQFSFFTFAAIMQTYKLQIASPTLTPESFISYSFTKTRSDRVAPRTFWRLEIGFMVFATETFLSFRKLLHRFHFKYWWVDTLPLGCILGVQDRIALLDSMVVSHGAKDPKKNNQGKTLRVDVAYTLSEKSWRGSAIAQYGCCDYMQKMRKKYMKEEDKTEFFKCKCTSGGLYC